LGGGEGEDGKRGYRRQEAGDGFKPLLPMWKTSTPDPLKRVTPAGVGQYGMRFALFIKVFFNPCQCGTVSPYRRRSVSRKYGSLPFLSLLGGGEGEDGKRGYRIQKTGGGRQFQAAASNVQNIHPRPAEAGHPRRRGTIRCAFTSPFTTGSYRPESTIKSCSAAAWRPFSFKWPPS